MSPSSRKGFTLIELLIVIVIVGVLAAVALPAYNSQVRKSRRADAVAAISQYQQAQERWRANNPTYATQAQASTAASATPPGLGLPGTSAGGYYTLAISNPTATGYRVTATAVAGKSQDGDTGCKLLIVNVANGTGTPASQDCWSK